MISFMQVLIYSAEKKKTLKQGALVNRRNIKFARTQGYVV